MNKTNDVQKVRQSEEAELKAELGQCIFLLHFCLRKASLRSLFPEHGGVCMGVQARACMFVGLMCANTPKHMHVHARTWACS